MGVELEDFIADFAQAMAAVDAESPVALNVRTKEAYQAGIGPHTETQTVRLVTSKMASVHPDRYGRIKLGVPYGGGSRQACDLCIGDSQPWEWAIEVKMLRLMGDNGKPNDNILMHILSPYPAHRSALTDCEKLLHSGLGDRKAIVIYAYEYESWPVEPVIEAFEVLAKQHVQLGSRQTSTFHGLVHPVHQAGQVVGWELLASRAGAGTEAGDRAG